MKKTGGVKKIKVAKPAKIHPKTPKGMKMPKVKLGGAAKV